MMLDKHERRNKRYLALEREYNSLLAAERKLPWTEVKPYQDGWFIYIDFRDEVKRRDDYPHLAKALEVVNRKGRTRNPKMVNKIRNTKRLEQVFDLFRVNKWGDQYTWYGSLTQEYGDYMRQSNYFYYHTDSPPVLARCHPDTYNKLHPATQKWLYKVTDDTKHWGPKEWYKSAIPDSFLKVRVKPAYVTHEKSIDPDLMKRMEEVSNEMKYLRNMGYSHDHYNWRSYTKHWGNKALRVYQRAAIQKFLKGESEDFEIKQKIKDYD